MLTVFAEERLDIAKFTCIVCDKLTTVKHRADNKVKEAALVIDPA
ncbi:hypothetical protein PROVALCAL_02571 [Providencia alcalifaciens DSM 30120]|jgi:hypothetical protein|uniref:Uncharacterized protein n=1 Tax=Providencia alcalifaciens DSM 30120 TaxID=520999 RepID=B6XGT5_9GAMM|nr:hypothetical protein PROVALCAL_02571 [Providencia alcalifaciens DSM 30120]